MSPPFVRDLADLRVAGYYLPATSFGYLYTQTQTGWYLWLTAIALLAAVTVHGLHRALPGPDVEADAGSDPGRGQSHRSAHRTPDAAAPTAIQLTYAALHGGGSPASYPATLRDAVRDPTVPAGPRRAVAVGFVVLAAAFVLFVPYSAWVLWTELPLDRMHPTYHLIGQTLIFLTATWAFQEVGWRLWPAVTIARSPASRDAQDGLEELRTFLTGPAGPEGVTHITYESRGGGYVLIDYVTAETTYEALRAELEDVAIGYLANALNDKYPCREVAVSVLGDDRAAIASFHIDGDWADAYDAGDITIREYVERVWDTLELYRTSGRDLLDADSQPDDALQAGLDEPDVPIAPPDADSDAVLDAEDDAVAAPSQNPDTSPASAGTADPAFGSGLGPDPEPAPGPDPEPAPGPDRDPATEAEREVAPTLDADSATGSETGSTPDADREGSTDDGEATEPGPALGGDSEPSLADRADRLLDVDASDPPVDLDGDDSDTLFG